MEFNKPKFYTRYNSPVGELFLIGNEKYLFEIVFDQPAADKVSNLIEKSESELEIFQLTKNWLDRYFAGENPDPKQIPIKFVGTDFQRLVWSDLQEIDYGQTLTYGELAKQVASQLKKKAMANQAIGQAVGRNPLPILVPCHRVVGTDGNLTGYSGGLEKKIKFLEIEEIDLAKFYLSEDKLQLLNYPKKDKLNKKFKQNTKSEQMDLDLE